MRKQTTIPKLAFCSFILSGVINYVVSFIASIIVGFYRHPATEWGEVWTFIWKFCLFSSLTFVVFFTVYTLVSILLKKLRVPTSLICLSWFPILLINLALLVAQIFMYLEYGEGINLEIVHIFGVDGPTIYQFMDDQYGLSYYIVVLVLVSILVPFVFRASLRSNEDVLLKNYVLGGSAGVLLAAVGGYILLIGDLSDEKQNLKILARDAFTSACYTLMTYHSFDEDGYKRYLKKLLEEGETESLETAVKWAGATPEGLKPVDVFARHIKEPQQQRPFDLKKKPSHIFYIQMEGQDNILFRNEDLSGLSPYFKKMMETGIYVPNFFASSGQTNASTHATLTSFPKIDIFRPTVWMGKTEHSLPQFLKQHLKFHTSVHSASYYHACNHGKLITSIDGVDDFTSYSNLYDREDWPFVWGISDELFVESIKKRFKPEGRHFGVFMNISNHAPYKTDVFAEGFEKDLLPSEYIKAFSKGGYDPVVRAGHYWYADREMGKLVDHLYKQYPDSLFIVTADHWSRYSYDKDPISEYTLPFVLWGPNIIPETEVGRKEKWFGTHADIYPTLAYLLLDDDFKLYSFGRPLWEQKKNFLAANLAGNDKYVYLNNRLKLYDYRSGSIVSDKKAENRLRRWWAGMNALTFRVMYSKTLKE